MIFNPTGLGSELSDIYETYNYIDVPSSNSLNFSSNSLRLVPSFNYVKDESSGDAGEYLVGSWNEAEQAGTGVMHRTYGSWNQGIMSNGSGQYVAGQESQGELTQGTPTSVVGIDASGVVAGIGTNASTGNVYGVRANEAVVDGFGGTTSATNVYDFFAENSAPNSEGYPVPPFSSGTITNYYGVYIQQHTAGVNNWNLYSVGGQNYFGGNVGIGTPTPGALLDVNGTSIILEQSYTPANSSSTCTTGTESWDANYEYRCVATNTWKRAALSSF